MGVPSPQRAAQGGPLAPRSGVPSGAVFERLLQTQGVE
jgi:hypothetical protein